MVSPPADDVHDEGRRAPWPLVLLVFLLLAPATAWAGTYFWLGTDPGQAQLRRGLLEDVRTGAVAFRRIQWGPAPDELWFLDAQVRDRAGRTAIGARAIGGELDLRALAGGELRLSRTRAVDFEVRLSWDDEATFNLKGAFRKGPPKPEEPPDPDAPPPPLVRFDGVHLARGLVTLDWPAWGLRFEAVDARGRVHLGGEAGLYIEADLDGARSRAEVDRRRRAVTFDALRIGGFTWEAAGFETRELRLTTRGGARVALAGGMGFGDAPRMDVKGDVALAGPETAEILGHWLPEGATVRGLDSRLEGEALTLTAERVIAPLVTAAGFRAEDVSLPLRLRGSPGGLVPEVDFHTRDARAARLEGPASFEARKVRVGTLDGTVSGTAELDVKDASAAGWSLPQGRVGATTADGRLEVGLGGGKVRASVQTDQGALKAEGTIDVSLLNREADIVVDMTLTRFTRTLARSVLAALPDPVAAELKPPLAGRARFSGKAAREDTPDEETGERAWSLVFHLTDGHLVGDNRVEYGDGGWITTSQAGDGGP